MHITQPLSSELHSVYLSHAEKLQHVTSGKKRAKKQPEKLAEDHEGHENASSTQNTTLNNDKTLEGLLADNIEPQQPIDLQFRQSLCEGSNSQLKSNSNENKKKRMEGKFFSKKVLKLSNQVLIENEITVLDKGLNFIPTPGKLDRYQIKKILNI